MTTAPSAAADAPLVRFAAVHKSYDGEVFAVRGLDLDVRRGEFLTLLGPSGSGKTTTLMMLAGFEIPSAGEVLFEGRPITGTPPHRRNFGMVFQNYALFPHLTVGGNVSYPLEVRGVPRAERARRAEQALAMVKLEGVASRRPDQLSGGQRQRVALARALVFEPPLVLMDEPLGALDKQLREHMQVELKDLHRRLGTTFIYVTHDQGEALTLSDRVAVFAGGELQQVDTPEALYERPANRFVASFVGDAVALAGTLQAGGELARVALPGGAQLEGVNVQAAAPGTPVLACIRPERIGVLPPGATAVNTLAATALDASYFGDHVRLRCALPGQGPIGFPLPLRALPAPPPGTAVLLELPSRHLRLYA